MQGSKVNTIYYEIDKFIYVIFTAHIGYVKWFNKNIKTVLFLIELNCIYLNVITFNYIHYIFLCILFNCKSSTCVLEDALMLLFLTLWQSMCWPSRQPLTASGLRFMTTAQRHRDTVGCSALVWCGIASQRYGHTRNSFSTHHLSIHP